MIQPVQRQHKIVQRAYLTAVRLKKTNQMTHGDTLSSALDVQISYHPTICLLRKHIHTLKHRVVLHFYQQNGQS